MSARDEVLSGIRRALGAGDERARRAAVEERLAHAPRGVVPARAQVPAAEQVALFKTMAEAALATVTVVDGAHAVPRAVAAYLRDHNLPAAIRRGADPRLEAMPWAGTALDVATGPSGGSDLSAVSHAEAGIAESGTLLLTSGPENPSTLNFLPDNHVVVVRAADVIGDLETAWANLRARHGREALPRTVNLITGPSRSGDIEQTMLLGAHGPRRLHVILVEDEPPSTVPSSG